MIRSLNLLVRRVICHLREHKTNHSLRANDRRPREHEPDAEPTPAKREVIEAQRRSGLLDASGLHALRVEEHSVVIDLDRTHLGEESGEPRGLWGTAPEQVEIFCGPVRLWGPRSEEHGALQDERVSMG